jgi:4-amino-4-deoxy-L-arabinose transferase-like glycosyltransferase
VGATAATYGFARSFFGRQVALRAAALFAAFPLAILSVRGI